MFEYIKGKMEQCLPTQAVVEAAGIGYCIAISLNTYSKIETLQEVKLWLHHIVREDDEQLYGFFTQQERDLFRYLLQVGGVGAATARMILSAMTPAEVRTAILTEDVARLKTIKGLGLKTAQKIIVELKDKMVKFAIDDEVVEDNSNVVATSSKVVEEALSALVMLGFQKAAADKVVRAIVKEQPDCGLEQLIKLALRRL